MYTITWVRAGDKENNWKSIVTVKKKEVGVGHEHCGSHTTGKERTDERRVESTGINEWERLYRWWTQGSLALEPSWLGEWWDLA